MPAAPSQGLVVMIHLSGDASDHRWQVTLTQPLYFNISPFHHQKLPQNPKPQVQLPHLGRGLRKVGGIVAFHESVPRWGCAGVCDVLILCHTPAESTLNPSVSDAATWQSDSGCGRVAPSGLDRWQMRLQWRTAQGPLSWCPL